MNITTFQEAKQAAFNASYLGLDAQGFRRAGYGNLLFFDCRWFARGVGHCAVGWLIPADRAALRPRGRAQTARTALDLRLLADPLQRWYDGASREQQRLFAKFLTRMQFAHDAAKLRIDDYERDAAQRKARFIKIAGEHKLIVPKSIGTYDTTRDVIVPHQEVMG